MAGDTSRKPETALTRRDALLLAGFSAASLSGFPHLALAETSTAVRVSSVRSGSVGWLIETIRGEGLDKKHGLDLKVVEVANNAAAPVALLAGEADIVVSDWAWALRQRAKGKDYKFAAFSSALGSLLVPKDSPISTLADLKGRRIGVAGSISDKSWVLLRAYSRKVLGKDISEIAEPVFGAAPLITEEFRSGRVDACLNFWTYAARLEGVSAKQILSMADVIKGLDVSPMPPLVGFIWSEKDVQKRGVPIDKFLAAAHDANEVLKTSDTAWERLRPIIKPVSDGEFAAIKDFFRSGITGPWNDAQTASAEKLTKLLVELGDTDFTGNGTRFDPNLFYTGRG